MKRIPILKNAMMVLFGAILLLSCDQNKTTNKSPLTVDFLQCEYLENPLAVEELQPRLQWKLFGEGRYRKQSAYRIIVASNKDNIDAHKGDLWDSGKVSSSNTNQVEYQGKELTSREHCFWKVMVWDEADQPSEWSPTANWKMGLLSYYDWKGTWIGLDVDYKSENLHLPPSPYLRKEVVLNKAIKSAMLYASAKGLYKMELNGQRVGESFFTPGWTDYKKRHYYNAFDVTELVRKGENAIGAILSNGWFAGYIGHAGYLNYPQQRAFYGESPGLLAQLVVTYEDGTKEIIASDHTWKGSTGPLLESDILMGETYDARLELGDWSSSGFDDSDWDETELRPIPITGKLQPYPSQSVQVLEEIKPLSVKEPEKGVYIFDIGKNMAGKVRLRVNGPAGTKVSLKFGEMLHDNGRVMTENLRKARATDTYILKGEGEEIWEPEFTYHGFQFVEMTGYPGTPDLNSITGLRMNSNTPRLSTFECSDPMVNQLYKNILTTQFANFFDVPTDCPQRDERLGWTGDAQVYVRSATINADVAAFYKKWLRDLDDAQIWFGAYPILAPIPYHNRKDAYATAWSDAGIIVPYTVYKVYNDKRILEEMYPGMEHYMRFLQEGSEGNLRTWQGNPYGDWLAIGEQVSRDLIGAAYYAYDHKLMAEMAEVLGKTEEAKKYETAFENIKKAFVNKYVDEKGKMSSHAQTAYAIAIDMGLLTPELETKAGQYLHDLIIENDGNLGTGFLGVKHLLPALTKTGYFDQAYDLLLNKDYPSWGYSIVNGSTSIWERWNSYTIEDGFMNPHMNSFSHYSFGSVCEWMYRDMAGIDMSSNAYKTLVINPQINDKMKFVNASQQTINGKIVSNWSVTGGEITMHVEIPVNTTAKVFVPANDLKNVTEGNQAIEQTEGIKFLGLEGNSAVFEVGSGVYDFKSIKN